ncbi:MAG: hypothetical protein ACXW3K_10810 [Brevundimonas sp.]
MTSFFGRKLNLWAFTAAALIVIAIKTFGVFQGWWAMSPVTGMITLPVAFAVGWLFGKPDEEPPA